MHHPCKFGEDTCRTCMNLDIEPTCTPKFYTANICLNVTVLTAFKFERKCSLYISKLSFEPLGIPVFFQDDGFKNLKTPLSLSDDDFIVITNCSCCS